VNHAPPLLALHRPDIIQLPFTFHSAVAFVTLIWFVPLVAELALPFYSFLDEKCSID
jgi:hypothetical protein